MNQKEHILQVACIRWFSYEYPNQAPFLFAIPNGGHRHLSTARKLKAEGVRQGVLDLFLAVPTPRHSGLFIEMKVKPNKPTPAQDFYLTQFKALGYQTALCYTFDEFRETITNYLKE